MRRRGAGLVAGVLSGAVVLAGCGGGPDQPASPASPATSATSGTSGTETVRYLALGDSYTAAPGLLPFADDPDGRAVTCLRSAVNYPHLVADAVPGVEVDDRSCSGADTDSVRETQLVDVDPETDVVTLGVGGNDLGLFAGLLGACATGGDCAGFARTALRRTLPEVQRRVGGLLDDVAAAVPDARVLVVGYPALVAVGAPEACVVLPIDAADLPRVARVNAELSAALRDAAQARGLTFVDVGAASRGHGVCAADPWVAGGATDPSGAIPFHPLPAGQRAVADLVAQALGS